MDLDRVSPYALAAFLGGAGVLHVVTPGFYDALIPSFLPAPRAWIYASGVVEIACGALVAAPRTRRVGGYASVALLVAVYPGNLWMAYDPGEVPRWMALARLPLQVPLVLWALRVAKQAQTDCSSNAVRPI